MWAQLAVPLSRRRGHTAVMYKGIFDVPLRHFSSFLQSQSIYVIGLLLFYTSGCQYLFGGYDKRQRCDINEFNFGNI